MKKTIFFVLMTILVGGIITVMVLANEQLQISASPLFGGDLGADIASNPNYVSTSTVDEMTQMADNANLGSDGTSVADEMTQAADQAGLGNIVDDSSDSTSSGNTTNTGGSNNSTGGSSGASSILPSQPSNLSTTDLGGAIQNIIQVLFYGSQIIFIIILLYGGVQYIISMGDEGKMGAARKTIFAALIGIVVVFSVWAIAQFVVNALK